MERTVVGARELKTRLGTYLRRVREGRTLLVTDRGEPVAELRPLQPDASVPALLLKLSTRRAVTLPLRKSMAAFKPIQSHGRGAGRRRTRRPRGSLLTRYFDASALVKRYVREPGAVSVRRLLKSGRGAASRLSEVEVASALVRRAREGAFTLEERDRALASLEDDFAALIIVEFTPEITAEARALLLRYRLRAGDAVQLASCLYLQRELSQSLPFVAFDDRLAEAARHQGLTVVSSLPRRH